MTLLDGPDLFHLTQETPGHPTHTVKVAILDGEVDDVTVAAWLHETVRRVPLLRRTIELRTLAPARWVEGPPVIDAHLDHRDLPSPGGEVALRGLLAELCASSLDRSRPLWCLHHVRDRGAGRSILVLRLHHALADGAASALLWQQLADEATAAASPETAPPASGGTGRVEYLLGMVSDGPRLARRWRSHGQRVAEARERGQCAAADAFSAPPTPFNDRLGGARACAFVDLPLDAAKQAGKRLGVSLNEVLLGLAGGAVRRYLTSTGTPLDASLTATVPAALPDRAEPYGNAVTTLYLSLHSDVEDPAARCRAIAADLRAARAVSAADPRLLPDSQRRWRFYRLLVALMRVEEKRRKRPSYNLIVSSVRGPDVLRILGHEVAELRSLGPLAGRLGLNITAWSYRGRLSLGVHAYEGAGDLERLGEFVAEEAEALIGASSAPASP